jgi:hypothetical protein
MKLAKQQVLPSCIKFLEDTQSARAAHRYHSTDLLRVLICRIRQARHSGSILGFSHKNFALPVPALDRPVRGVCPTLDVVSYTSVQRYLAHMQFKVEFTSPAWISVGENVWHAGLRTS